MIRPAGFLAAVPGTQIEVERETGLEPATPSLEGSRSTN
jgi:hypothetical protein